MIEMGRKYRDKITGFEGVATGYVEYITGCNQVLLAPRVKEDGNKVGSEWYDEQRLELVGEEIIKLDNGINPGCDMAAPIK
jgi:hypothetical protein